MKPENCFFRSTGDGQTDLSQFRARCAIGAHMLVGTFWLQHAKTLQDHGFCIYMKRVCRDVFVSNGSKSSRSAF